MRVYGKCLAAYLSGWLIVQPVYNRLFAAWRRREIARPDGLYAKQVRDEALAIVDELERRGVGQMGQVRELRMRVSSLSAELAQARIELAQWRDRARR